MTILKKERLLMNISFKNSFKKFMFLEDNDYKRQIREEYYNEIRNEEYKMEAYLRG